MLVVLGSRARIALLVAVAILALQQESAGAVLTVTTADDAVATNGFASLREAIVSINDGADVNADVTAVRTGSYGSDDEIHFAIGSGAQILSPAVALPMLRRTMTIDGSTQPGFSGAPLITLDGKSAGSTARGLTISLETEASVIALTVQNFGGAGIVIADPSAVPEVPALGPIGLALLAALLASAALLRRGSTSPLSRVAILLPALSIGLSGGLAEAATLDNVSVVGNGASGVVVVEGGMLTVTGSRVLGNAGHGIDLRGGLSASAVEIGSNGGYGILVDSAAPVVLTDCDIHHNGQTGVYAIRASNATGLVLEGFQSQVHDNGGNGVTLGDLTAQTGAVLARIADAQIFGNQIGIRVQQKNAGALRTTSTIVFNNIFDNVQSGLYLSSSFQKPLTSQLPPYIGNDVHHNAVVGLCTPATGDQFASQVVFDGPISAEPALVAACGQAEIDTQNECVSLLNSNGALSGGVTNECVWNGSQCVPAWGMRGNDASFCQDSSRNRIFAYVRDSTADPFTQRGIAAINGAMVNARSNSWGSGGAINGIFSSSDSGIDATNDCGSISACP
jgi:hypothetical protein